MVPEWTRWMHLVITVGTLMAAAIAEAPAYADLKILSEITATGTLQQAQTVSEKSSPQVVTTCYKGDKARVVAADGTITIYDRAADKVYTLNPADKTYSVVPLKQFLKQGPDLTGRMPANARVKLESKVDLKQDNDAQKKTFAGEEAVKYSLTGSVTMRRDFGGGFPGGGFPGRRRFPGGGFPGGGRFPGGGFPGGGRGPGGGGRPGGGPGSYGRRMPSFQIDGEYWIADAPRIAIKKKDPILPSIVQTVPAGPFLSPLNDKFAKTKGFPVASKVIVTMTSPQSQTPTTFTTTTEVKSITDATLDESLFKVPDDYKEVAPRPVPVRPGAGDTGRPMATSGSG